jgi:hypothetical protein
MFQNSTHSILRLCRDQWRWRPIVNLYFLCETLKNFWSATWTLMKHMLCLQICLNNTIIRTHKAMVLLVKSWMEIS